MPKNDQISNKTKALLKTIGIQTGNILIGNKAMNDFIKGDWRQGLEQGAEQMAIQIGIQLAVVAVGSMTFGAGAAVLEAGEEASFTLANVRSVSQSTADVVEKIGKSAESEAVSSASTTKGAIAGERATASVVDTPNPPPHDIPQGSRSRPASLKASIKIEKTTKQIASKTKPTLQEEEEMKIFKRVLSPEERNALREWEYRYFRRELTPRERADYNPEKLERTGRLEKIQTELLKRQDLEAQAKIDSKRYEESRAWRETFSTHSVNIRDSQGEFSEVLRNRAYQEIYPTQSDLRTSITGIASRILFGL